MFCPNCGAQNTDYDRFCAECGTMLKSSSTAQQTNTETFTQALKTIPKPSKKQLAVIIPCVSVVLIAVTVFAVLSKICSADTVGKNYVKYLAEGNYEKAFEYLDVEADDFINAEQFAKYFASLDVEIPSDYSIWVDSYTPLHIVEDESGNSLFGFDVIKKDEKQLLFFPLYKVSADNITSKMSIATLAYSTVNVDGIPVESYTADANNNNKQFYVNNMFYGNHIVEIVNPLCVTYTTEVTLDEDYSSKTFINYNLTPKEDIIIELENKTEKNIEKIMQGLLSGKSFDELSLDCTESLKYLNNLKEKYNEWLNDIGEAEKPSGTFTVTVSGDDVSQHEFSDKSLTYECRLVCTATVSFENGKEAMTLGRWYITYVYENENWKIQTMNWYYY